MYKEIILNTQEKISTLTMIDRDFNFDLELLKSKENNNILLTFEQEEDIEIDGKTIKIPPFYK